MMNLESRIRELLGSILSATDSYLVELKVRTGQLVQIFVDRDPHITIEDCALISRELEKELNREFRFSEQYALEVSSPGMDQPFKVFRQYTKNVGRKVNVVLFSGMKKTGTLLYADEDKILLEETLKARAGQVEQTQTEIPFVNIKSTNIVITF